jgi:hypothetical protein
MRKEGGRPWQLTGIFRARRAVHWNGPDGFLTRYMIEETQSRRFANVALDDF